ncbi:PREDICTED: F-box/FBD/LRR-repeat protein At3g52680-like [Camelina sativa]|uniref:F-box/FBD/LRR-repeat protein At3g52680-like n=1 Tax=Camelina sativa TaxID=90675 RepID=A0ABM1RLG5_CAMSA|nr:PREDICTED: F-box/FBD/LRR-repeat protein At3g52680-like [Camelina sativa]
MEQEQRLRKRGVVNDDEDRLNLLPEALILKILCFLPTKTVVTTSVLSKQWRSLWKFVPNLEFNSEDCESEDLSFSEIVSKSLLSHKAPVLDSFRLLFGSEDVSFVDVGLWVGIAFARHLRELVLDFYPSGKETFTFPSSLSTCNTLESLKLVFGFTVDIPSPVLMKSLRTLHLEFVSFKEDVSVRNLLSSCPGLEQLIVYRGEDCDVEIFTIEVPSLQRLKIHDTNDGAEFWGYVINAPCLKYLHIEDLRCPGFSLNAPELVEASIVEAISITNKKLLGSLTSVKRLLLHLSPLRKYNHVRSDSLVRGKWNEPKYVPECLLSHLETFVWKRFGWGREEEKEIATYILKNARRLKKAHFSTIPIDTKELNKLRERSKVLSELDGVVRASNSCHLVFKFDASA